VCVIERERCPSRDRERGKSGEDPGKFMIVGESVSGTYCGTLLSLSDRAGPDEEDGQA
jgi:hypothetical protein